MVDISSIRYYSRLKHHIHYLSYFSSCYNIPERINLRNKISFGLLFSWLIPTKARKVWWQEKLVTLNLQAGSREQWVLVLRLSPPYSVCSPGSWNGRLTFRLGLHISDQSTDVLPDISSGFHYDLKSQQFDNQE